MRLYKTCFHLAMLGMVLLFAGKTNAQENFGNWLKKKDRFEIKPFMMVQLWGNYSFGQKVYQTDKKAYEAVDDRFNVLLRRARVGFRAEPYAGLKFTFMGAYDLVGRDVNTSLVGGANNGSLPSFGVWDAFFQWRLRKGSESLNLVGGYFRPQLSRESITAAWAVNSMEKSMSQNYIRQHLVGTGPGRAAGLNIGGLLLREDRKLGLNYNLGVFNPLTLANSGNSTGKKFAPLLVGRAVVYLGDPEMDTYRISYDINYFGRRKGLSIGLSGSWQGATGLFRSSYTAQADILFNWGPLNVDGDWNLMWREGRRNLSNDTERLFTYASQTGHLRMGYNLVLGGKVFLEPAVMVMAFQGASDQVGQADAGAVGASSGQERTYDLGLNWYLDQKNLKVLLHYTWHDASAGEADPGFTGNQFFQQSGVGAIRRGNWVGLGLHIII